MTNIDENCKVIDAAHPHIEPNIGYVEPEVIKLISRDWKKILNKLRETKTSLVPIDESLHHYVEPELSVNDKIIYMTKVCGHKMSFVHDSISVQIKDNRPVSVQYGQPYGFTYEQAMDELYKYVKGF